MEPEISYIVICFNSEKYISKCISSILNQSHSNYEIIVMDNNSQDGTKSVVNDLCMKVKQIKLITNTINIGYGNAITKAIESSSGKFLVIMNADTVLDKQWTDKMLHAFNSDEQIMSASGTIFFPTGELQSTGGMMDKYGAVIQRGSKIFHSRKIKSDSFFYNDGSSLMVRRSIFQKTSFDPKLFLYYEDVDLSWKIRMLGYKVEHVPEAISYHDAGHSSAGITPTKFYHITKNRLYICQKNYSMKNIVCRIPIMLFLIFCNAIFYDITKKPLGYTMTVFKAIFWNLTNLGFIIKEQKQLRSLNKLSDCELDQHLIGYSIEFSLLNK